VHGDQLWDENSCLRTADLTDAPFSNGSVTIVVFRVGYLRRMLIHGRMVKNLKRIEKAWFPVS
jgi:hypothetical protein